MYDPRAISDKIKMLAKEKKIPIKVLLEECGLSKNTLSSMQSGGSLPKSENLAKIADGLNVSVDYLLGRTDDPNLNTKKQAVDVDSLSKEEITALVISSFRGMSARDRREFLSLALHELEEQLQEDVQHVPDEVDP